MGPDTDKRGDPQAAMVAGGGRGPSDEASTAGGSEDGRGRARATWAFVIAFSLAASLCAVALSRVRLPYPHHTLPPVLVGIVVLAIERLPVTINVGRQTQRFDLTGVPILVGAILLPPWQTLVVVLAAWSVNALLRRGPVIKSLFNVANQVAAASAAVFVLVEIVGKASPVSPRGWLAIATASVALDAVAHAGVIAVMTVSGGRPDREFVKRILFQAVLLPGIDFAMVVVAIACFWTQPWALLVLLGPALILGWWYSVSERLRARFTDLQSLYGYSRALADVTERTDVLAVALRETRTVLRCDNAELCVQETDGLIRYRLDAEGRVVEEAVEVFGPEQTVLETQRPVLVPHNSRSSYLAQRSLKDAMAVPLSVGGSRSAVLVVTDRHGSEANSFSKEDLDFLQALAAHLSTALTSSDHLDHLRRSVAEREHQAFHDGLTGLANRTLFMNVLSAALQSSGGHRMVAVVLMDLDGFKEINDALGHHTGDSVLKVIASRVNSEAQEFGLAARLGGDEFAFLIPEATSVDEITNITERLMESVGAVMEIDNMALTVRASVGVALAPIHGLDAATLLKKADVAMYTAKNSSRRVNLYEASMDNSSARRLALATDLGRAIEADELELWYQPVADVTTGVISGFEALLRWPHRSLGFVPPDEFIPIAEQTGLIEPLTWWVAREALGELRRWRDAGYEFSMAINVSARTLLDTGIVERLRRLVAEFDLTATNLTLEITESSMMLEYERSESVLRHLSDMGFQIAIDDFGTGYSSLSRLKVLPVQVVKIDRAFIKNICTDKGDQAIVRSIIELARVMGHQVVAEGIEDLQTWSRLATLGCDMGQGYYFARPMLASACRTWVMERQAPSVATVRRLPHKRAGGA